VFRLLLGMLPIHIASVPLPCGLWQLLVSNTPESFVINVHFYLRMYTLLRLSIPVNYHSEELEFFTPANLTTRLPGK